MGVCKISECTSILGNDQKEHNLLQLCEAYFNAKPGGNVDPRGDPHGELKNQNHFTTIGIDKEKIIKDFGLENEAALNLKLIIWRVEFCGIEVELINLFIKVAQPVCWGKFLRIIP